MYHLREKRFLGQHAEVLWRVDQRCGQRDIYIEREIELEIYRYRYRYGCKEMYICIYVNLCEEGFLGQHAEVLWRVDRRVH